MGDASPVSRRSTRHARRTHLDHSVGPLSMRFLCASPRKRLSCQLFQPGPSCDFSYCAWPCGSCLACFCAASFRTYPSRLFLLAYFFSFLVRRKFGLRDPHKIYRLAAFQNDFLMSAQRFFINSERRFRECSCHAGGGGERAGFKPSIKTQTVERLAS